MKSSGELPYFDILFEGLRRGRPGVAVAFGRHAHWGYWGGSDRPDGTAADFARAAERLAQRVCDAAPVCDGERVLDVGCGFGGTLASLDERRTGMELCGLNIDGRQLAEARRRVTASAGNRIELVLGDACALPFADGSFDVVLAIECIFHFASRARFFAEARRVLRPGGRLVISDFVPARSLLPLVGLQDFVFGGYQRRVSGRADIRCSLAQYRVLARSSGFVPGGEEDITANTLPTYPVVRDLFREIGIHVPIATGGAALLEWAGRLGLLRYYILSFARREPWFWGEAPRRRSKGER